MHAIRCTNNKLVAIKPKSNNNTFKPLMLTFKQKDHAELVKTKLENKTFNVKVTEDAVVFDISDKPNQTNYKDVALVDFPALNDSCIILGRDIFITRDVINYDSSTIYLAGYIKEVFNRES